MAVELNKATTANIRIEVGSVTTASMSWKLPFTDTTTAQVANSFETRMAVRSPRPILWGRS
jgi:hypothetical protein